MRIPIYAQIGDSDNKQLINLISKDGPRLIHGATTSVIDWNAVTVFRGDKAKALKIWDEIVKQISQASLNFAEFSFDDQGNLVKPYTSGENPTWTFEIKQK